MDTGGGISGPATPRPSLKRPSVYRKTSDYVLPASSPPLRRESEPALYRRRSSAAAATPIPMRIGIPPFPRQPLMQRARHSDRSVTFSMPSPFGVEMAPLRSQPHTPTYPLLQLPEVSQITLFGWPTRYRPLWLLAMANASSCLLGLGAVIVQRAVWPVRQYDGLNPSGPTVLPGGSPGHGTAFGGVMGGIVGGSLMIAAGTGGAVAASTLLMLDGRRLNRAQNPSAPNYRRTHGYFAFHQLGIAILVANRFITEAFRSSLPPNFTWVIALPGGTGSALFAVTQAQSFSSSELACGRMPLNHRGTLNSIARAGIASYIVLGAVVGTPNASSYVREIVRLVASVSTNVAYSLPLVTARLAGPAADIPIGGQRYRGDWSAMQAFSLYAAARLIGTIASFWLARSRWPASSPPPRPDGPPNFQSAFRGLPPPLPTLPPDWDEVAASAVLMGIGFGLCVYAFSQFHRDATPPLSQARAYYTAAVTSLALGLIFRALQERAKALADFQEVWLAVIPGFTAQALAFVAIPEMLARSESTAFNSSISHRYQVIEACRGIGGISWYLWASMNGLLGFPPIVRQLTIWTATTATVLALALPTADTLRAGTGPTPQREIPNPFG